MKFSAKHFDKLREKASFVSGPMERKLFLSVIKDMEKITNMITQAKVDIRQHDCHGRVELIGKYLADEIED